jgi:site-specific DNA-adenine methylase
MAAYLRREGVHVILSNADLPSVRTLYSGFNLESVQVRRNVNRDGKKRGAVGELIIT